MLGAPQTYEYFQPHSGENYQFIAKHSDIEKKDIEKMMVTPGILTKGSPERYLWAKKR